MARFDPAAWLAEYEALGGGAAVIRQPNGEEGLYLTYPRDPAGRGYELRLELNPDHWPALGDHIVATRGVREVAL